MSKRSSYTDYYKMNWDVVIKSTSSSRPKLIRFLLIFISIVVLGLTAFFLNKQLGFSSYEFFWLIFIFGAAVIFILGIFWGKLDQLVGSTKVYTYTLNYNGLVVNQQHYDFEEFDLDKLKKNFSEKSLKPVEHSYYYSVNLPKHNLGQLSVYLPTQETTQKFITSLQHYIEDYED